MTHSILRTGFALALISLPLAACVDGGYGYGVQSTWVSNPYNGWYDGHYGSIYDGYWGTDNNFYYRQNEHDGYRRGNHNHFQRSEAAPDSRYQRLEGQTRQPPQGTRMPRYPGSNNGGGNRMHGHRPHG